MTVLEVMVAWVLEPGDPVQNDRRAEIILVITLALVWLAPVCVFTIIGRGGA